MPVLTVDFGPMVEGRPQHFHGGATAGLLETAGYAALRTALLAAGRDPQLKPINITVQYLAAGKSQIELCPRPHHPAGAAQCQCHGGGVAG